MSYRQKREEADRIGGWDRETLCEIIGMAEYRGVCWRVGLASRGRRHFSIWRGRDCRSQSPKKSNGMSLTRKYH